MKNKTIAVILVLLIAVIPLASCKQKRRCADCGKTEDETELFLFSSDEYPEGDDNYYCSVHIRPRIGSQQIPGVAEEIEKAIGSESETEMTASQSVDETEFQPLKDYLEEGMGYIGADLVSLYKCDIDQDGTPELCATALISEETEESVMFVVVYDVNSRAGYSLEGAMIKGCSEDLMVAEKDGENGTLSIEDNRLVFTVIN